MSSTMLSQRIGYMCLFYMNYLSSDMLKVPVPFQLCIFTHPVVYFSGSILARRSLSIVFEFGSGSVCHRSGSFGLVRFAERYGFLFGSISISTMGRYAGTHLWVTVINVKSHRWAVVRNRLKNAAFRKAGYNHQSGQMSNASFVKNLSTCLC